MFERDETDTSPPGSGEETFQELMERSAVRRDSDERPRTPKPHAGRRAKPRIPAAAPAAISDPGDEFMRPGLQHREMQRLKQGKFRLSDDGRIDLHGLKLGEAHQALIEFLDRCLLESSRYALIICGKGLHSPTGKPVLRSAIRSDLAQHPKVLAYCPAQLKDGGSGALYVLLKTKARRPGR